MLFRKIILRKGKEDAIKRFHPWVFSGALDRQDPDIAEGDLVEVISHSGEILGIGYYNTSSITVKMLSFEPVADVYQHLQNKFVKAYNLRQTIGLANNSQTTAYRLINAEGDGIPGLIVDWYNGHVVLQAYHKGIYLQRALITEIMTDLLPKTLRSVYDKSAGVLAECSENQHLQGEITQGEIQENSYRFLVDWQNGQKTGFFLDQRENRHRLMSYVADKTVLNTFCYSGGFSVYALQGGAKLVHSVDISTKAIAWAVHNVNLNSTSPCHETFVSDIFTFLKQTDRTYEVIVLDPPAFAKNITARHQAVMAYKRLHQLAFERLQSGGIMFTFSCSQVVSPEHFLGAITAAAIESGRAIRILERLSQPADHPTSVYHPEGIYLKGFVLWVE